MKDLYGSQVEVLQAWFSNREEKDHVIKLHTGGGKTLAGLLIGLAILHETSEPVVFICPNIVDDAQVGSNVVRDAFTIRVKRILKDAEDETYVALSAIFHRAFSELGQLGTYDDVVEGHDHSVLEVPYWSWQEKLEEVQAFLRERVHGRFEFQWPLSP